MIFSPHFHFKAFPEKERERERERARACERRRNRIVSLTIAGGLLAPGGADLQSDDRREDRDRRREIAQLIAISPSTEIAINGAISRCVDCAIAPSRACDASIARSCRCELAPLIARSRSQIAIVNDIFLRFVFSFFFSKHQKIFSGKFFEMQPNTWKYFPFPEISISGKYVFSGKRFTATKHSLRATLRRKLYFTTLNYILYYILHHKLFKCTLCTINYDFCYTSHLNISFIVKLDKN